MPPWTRVTAYWLSAHRRTWRASAFTDFAAPLLFLAGMGFGLGSLVDGGAGGSGGAGGAGGAAGVPYAVLVAPGVLAAQAMQTAVGESTFSVMGAIKWQRQHHAVLAAPLRVGDVVAGHLAWVVLRVAVTSAVFLLVAVLLGVVPPALALAALPVVVLQGLGVAGLVHAVAARSESDQPSNVLFRFVVTPLFLFSGTFFPVTQLPGALQAVAVAVATPLHHGVAAARQLWLGQAGALAVLGHCAYLVVPAALGVALAHRSLLARMVV